MGDMAEYFNDMREHSKEKREKNRNSAPAILHNAGLSFTEKNNGAHLIVEDCNLIVDFWPGTGKYIPRGNAPAGRGIFNLLKLYRWWKEKQRGNSDNAKADTVHGGDDLHTPSRSGCVDSDRNKQDDQSSGGECPF